MRISPVSVNAAFMRPMPSIDQIARVQKRIAPEGIGKQRPASQVGKKGVSSLKHKSRVAKRRAAWDGLGQEVDVRV